VASLFQAIGPAYENTIYVYTAPVACEPTSSGVAFLSNRNTKWASFQLRVIVPALAVFSWTVGVAYEKEM
jgi:hypothetical protein